MASLACILLFRPFLIEIIISAVLVSVFYSPFLKLSKLFKGRRKLAAFLMCLILLLIIIIPISNLIILAGKQSSSSYSETINFINKTSNGFKQNIINNFDFIDPENEYIKDFIFGATKTISDWMSRAASSIIKETTAFMVSLALIVLTMFFFFVDGEKMLNKLKVWSPLPNKYDIELFKKFREVSYSAMISTFLTAGVQGIIGAIGFLIAGVPAFYPGILIALFSLIPYIGSMAIYIPIGIYLILAGQVFQGVFILAWGAIIIGNTDNLIRAWILKSGSKINPIFIIFSLMGGITLFGFWGLVLGPLLLSLVATVFHIYEVEYNDSLDI